MLISCPEYDVIYFFVNFLQRCAYFVHMYPSYVMHLNTDMVEIELPVRWVYWSDTRKIKSLLGYQPSGSVNHVFEAALAHERGELIDVIPA